MSGEAQLEALLEIINTAARQAIAEYKKGGNEVPTIYSRTQHPIDSATDTMVLKKAVRSLEGACQQLCASLAPPQHTVHNYVMSFEPACVRVIIRTKITDVLQNYPNGLHVKELAKLVNLEKGKLGRLLRLLATKGCFTEVQPDVFANNRISLTTRSDSPLAAYWLGVTESVSKGAAVLYETMTEPQYMASYAPEKSPLMYALNQKGIKGNLFDWLREDEERLDVRELIVTSLWSHFPGTEQNFHHAMSGVSFVMGSLSVLHHYPWSEVDSVCDVGGSVGTVTIPLFEMYPHLQIVVQDLPEVLLQAKEVWAMDGPGALEDDQVTFVPLDFFQGSPVEGRDVYYLRNIIHNWPDAEAGVIMRNIRSVMAPDSRFLIHDYVLTPAIHDLSVATPTLGMGVAPQSLLANFGNGNNRMFQQDLNMLLMMNGKERTLEELISLGSAAGLSLEKVYDLGETAVLDFRIAT